MPHTYWALAPSLNQVLFTIIAFCVWTLIGALVMKYFVRQVPILNHAGILFWAAFRVQIIFFVLILLASASGISIRPLSGIVSVLALCATGWLVTQHLSTNYGVPTKFPAVGAKVMTTMSVVTLIVVIAMIVITGA